MRIKKMVTWVLSLLCLAAPCIIVPETLGAVAPTEAEAENADAVVESAPAGRVGRLTIASNDVATYTITYAADINDCAKFAAEELQKYLEKATGIRVPIEADSDAERRIELVCDESGDHGDEGFTIGVEDGNLRITGGTRRGNLYGVYEFLEQYVGYRFLTEDEEYLYETESIDIPEGTADTQNPVFEYRDVDWAGYYSMDMTVKRKIDGYTSAQSERKKLAFGEYLAKYGGGLGRSSWNSHSIGDMCGTDRQTEQPCLTDEENYQKILTAVMELIEGRLASGQEIRQVSVSQEDNQNYCTCARCAAVDAEEGSHMGTILRLVNRVAEAVKEAYPENDISIVTLAYQYSRKPTAVTKAHDNVIIFLCYTDVCFNHAFDDTTCEYNVGFASDLSGWSRISRQIYVWDYHYDSSFRLSPFPVYDQYARNMQFLARNKVTGYYGQGLRDKTVNGKFGELSAYLTSKLAWNPNMTDAEYNEIINEFLKLYYGGGWEYLRQYMDFLIESGDKCGHWQYEGWTWPWSDAREMDFAVNAEELDGWFEKASAAATDTQKLRIEQLMIHYKFLKLSARHVSDYVYGSEAIRSEYIKDYDNLMEEVQKYDLRFGWSSFPAEAYDYSVPPYYLYESMASYGYLVWNSDKPFSARYK